MLITEAHQTGLHVLFIDLAPRASGESPAEGSLEVAEFDDGDRSAGIAFEVARLSHHGIHQRCGNGAAERWAGTAGSGLVSSLRRGDRNCGSRLGCHELTLPLLAPLRSPTTLFSHCL